MRFNLLGLSIIDWPLNYIRRARFRKKSVVNRERDTAAFKRPPGMSAFAAFENSW